MSGHLPGAVSPIIRVLLIDDNVDKLKITKAFMERADPTLSVDTEVSPRRAIASVKGKRYDAIVTDYHMPEMDGLTLTRMVRETEKVPVILYTGMGSEEVAEAAFKAGVNDYMMLEASPAHYRVLVNRVRYLVERHRVEEVYRGVVEGSMDAFAIVVGTSIVYVNQAMAGLLGVGGPEDLMGEDITSWITEVDGSGLVGDALGGRQDLKGPDIHEAKIRRVDGEVRFVEASVSFINYDGRPAVLAFCRDVTEKRAMEEAQRRERERLEVLQRLSVKLNTAFMVEEVADITLEMIRDTVECSVAAFCMVWGDRVEVIKAHGVDSMWERAHLLGSINLIEEVVRTGASQLVHDAWMDPGLRSLIQVAGLDIRSLLSVPVKLGSVTGAVMNVGSREPGAFTDEARRLLEVYAELLASVLERIEKRRDLIKTELEKRSFLENLGGITYRINLDASRPPVITGNVEEITGFRPEEIPAGGPQWSTLIHPEDLPMVEEWETRLEADPGIVANIVYRVLHRDGSTRWVNDIGQVIRTADQSRELHGVIFDVSSNRIYERKIEALHRSADSLAEAKNVEEAYEITLETIKEVFGYRWAGVGVVDDRSIRYVRYVGIETPMDFELPLDGPGVTVRAVKERRSQLVPERDLILTLVPNHNTAPLLDTDF